MFNMYPNFSDVPDKKMDYVLPDGRTVDVKSTELEEGKKKRLLIKTNQASRLRSDLYALVVVNLADMQCTLKGFATKEEILQAPVINFGYGPSFAVEMDKLHQYDNI